MIESIRDRISFVFHRIKGIPLAPFLEILNHAFFQFNLTRNFVFRERKKKKKTIILFDIACFAGVETYQCRVLECIVRCTNPLTLSASGTV